MIWTLVLAEVLSKSTESALKKRSVRLPLHQLVVVRSQFTFVPSQVSAPTGVPATFNTTLLPAIATEAVWRVLPFVPVRTKVGVPTTGAVPVISV